MKDKAKKKHPKILLFRVNKLRSYLLLNRKNGRQMMEKMAGKKMGAYLEVYTFDNKGEKKFFSDNQKLNIPIAHPY